MASSNVLNSEFLVCIFWHIWDGNQTLQNWVSKTLCFSQAFLCLIVIFHKALNLGDDICGRFNADSINIIYKTCKSTKSPLGLQNHLANVQEYQVCLSNGIMRLITRISKFSCCLYSVKIVCIRSDSVLKSLVFCKVQLLLSLQHVKTKNCWWSA